MTSSVLRTARAVTRWLTTYRRASLKRLNIGRLKRGLADDSPFTGGAWKGFELISMCPRGSAACDGPHQRPRNRIYYDGHKEQGETDLNECAEIHVTGRFGELVCDDAGQRVAGGKERLRNVGM